MMMVNVGGDERGGRPALGPGEARSNPQGLVVARTCLMHSIRDFASHPRRVQNTLQINV